MTSTPRQVLCRTREDAVRLLYEGAVRVRDLQDQLLGHLGEAESGGLFARWKPASAPGLVEWWVASGEPAVPATDLSEEEQIRLANRLQERVTHVRHILQTAWTIDEQERRTLLSALEQALRVPSEGSVWLVGEEPVLVDWGAMSAASRRADPVARLLERAEPLAELTIRVVDEASGQPLTDRTVTLAPERGRPRRLQTDADGRATFADVSAANPVHVAVDDEQPQALSLRSGQNQHTLSVSVPPPPVEPISGVVNVRRADGSPAADTEISGEAIAPDGSHHQISTRTGEDGSARLEALPPDTRLQLSAGTGERRASGAGVLGEDTPEIIITLPPERESAPKRHSRLAVALAILAAVAGVVIIAAGLYLAGLLGVGGLSWLGGQWEQLVRKHGGTIQETMVTLQWSTRDDLDLHVVCPDGKRIYFDNRRACGGELDIDANHRQFYDPAVENVGWESDPPPGRYTIQVWNVDRNGESGPRPRFRVRVQVAGDEEHFELQAPAPGGHIDVGSFSVE